MRIGFEKSPKLGAFVTLVTALCWSLFSLTQMVQGVRFASQTLEQNAGTSLKTLQVGTAVRSYLVHVPPSYDKTKPIPLVLVFHGGGGQPQQIERHTNMSGLADREHFLVAYPEGINGHWNDGRENSPQVDDVEFVRALIEDIARSFNVDRKRTYVTGISNGGMFSQRAACELSGTIAAIASVAATMPEALSVRCKPMKSISVLIIHGTNDPLIPYHGGALTRTNLRGNVLSARDAIKFWATHNKCSANPVTDQLPDRDPEDGTRIRRERYSRCGLGVEVELDTVDGGGHTLPGSRQYLPERLIGKTSRDIDGCEAIWDFFKRHSIK